jgi:hypothetical protein
MDLESVTSKILGVRHENAGDEQFFFRGGIPGFNRHRTLPVSCGGQADP